MDMFAQIFCALMKPKKNFLEGQYPYENILWPGNNTFTAKRSMQWENSGGFDSRKMVRSRSTTERRRNQTELSLFSFFPPLVGVRSAGQLSWPASATVRAACWMGSVVVSRWLAAMFVRSSGLIRHNVLCFHWLLELVLDGNQLFSGLK